MSAPNQFEKSSRYRRYEHWHDPANACLIWPALWTRRHVTKGLFVEETVWTLGWRHHRWQWVKGQDLTPNLNKPIGWQEIKGPEFLQWAAKTFEGNWAKEQAQSFFRRHTRWRDLVVQGHLDNHYVRILMAREMMAEQHAEPDAESQESAFSSL